MPRLLTIQRRAPEAAALAISLFLLLASPAFAVPIEDARIAMTTQYTTGFPDNTIRAFTDLPLTTVDSPDPGFPNRYHTASAEVVDGAIRLYSEGEGDTRILQAMVRDTYTVVGATAGTPVALTVSLHIEGDVDVIQGHPLFPTSGNVDGLIGGDFFGDSPFEISGSPLIAGPGRAVTGGTFLFPNGPNPIDLTASAVVGTRVGDTFTLAYAVGLNMRGTVTADFTNTATVSFDLPPGVSLTSVNGFGTSVPEPSAAALLAVGLALAQPLAQRLGARSGADA
ncbi:MAG: hypothetical protein QNK05_17740 [Myxococcota bacterium]|nr:hypothetical protein [Myxococcota bacterium]